MTINFNLRFVLRLIFLFPFFAAPLLHAQTEEQHFARRIVWSGGEHVLHFAVEVEKLLDGEMQELLRGYTRELFFDVSLPQGDYRFRIIPYDILGRPGEETPWFNFTVRYVPQQDIDDLPNDFPIIIAGYIAPEADPIELAALQAERGFRHNTLGVSAGTSIASDPLFIITAHGTFSLVRNLFVEVGFDLGFGSTYSDVERRLSFYPFVHLGYFFPVWERLGFFVSAGGGYMIANYRFSYGSVFANTFAANFSAGVQFRFLTASYTLRTDFSTANSKISLGFIHRL